MLEAPFAINGIANMLKSCADDYCRDAMIGYQKDMGLDIEAILCGPNSRRQQQWQQELQQRRRT
jgi:hypothetical protein